MLAGFAVASLVACASDDTVDEEEGADEGALEVDLEKDSAKVAGTVPLLEVSALGLRDGKLLALGDREFKIVVDGAIRGKNVEVAAANVKDLSTLFPANPRGAQWEGIAADGSGKLFLLEENPGRIFVLDVSGAQPKLAHTITLTVPTTEEEWTLSWNENANSRGEGFVLLKNGHILVAKEKDPRRLVEFGPSGAPAAGFKPGDEVTSQTFPVRGATSEMVPLKAWKVEGDANKGFKDVSELAVGKDGLYLLSDESRAIARIPALDKKSPDAVADKKWNLPFKANDEEKKTEGLVILPGSKLVALVALDGPKKDNVYRVELE